MAGVATQMNVVITCKNDLKGELLTMSLSDKCKGISMAKSLEDAADAPPTGGTLKVLWALLVNIYQALPDGSGHRCPTASSESTSSFTADDLKDTFAKLKSDLLDTLPDLVAPKVSEILAPKSGSHSQDTSPGVGTLEQDTSPATPVKRYLSIKDKGNDGTTPMCETRWSTVLKPQVETALKSIPVLDLSVNKRRTHLHFETDDQLEQAKEKLSPFLEVSTFVEKEKRRDPRIMINDLDQDLLDKERLISAIVSDKNQEVKKLNDDGHEIRVVHVNKTGRYAVVQVTPEVRKAISERKDRLFLKLRQHVVKNRSANGTLEDRGGPGRTFGNEVTPCQRARRSPAKQSVRCLRYQGEHVFWHSTVS
eukprot:sb/3465921/